MFNAAIFSISAVLLGIAWALNGVLAGSRAPEFSWVVAGTFMFGLSGMIYLTMKVIDATREWRSQ